MKDQVVIQSFAGSNVGGVSVGEWSDVCTIWAEQRPIGGREAMGQQQIGAEVTTRFVIHYRTDVTEMMRLKLGTRYFDIQSVIDPTRERKELHLMCLERRDGGTGVGASMPTGWKLRTYTLADDSRTFTLALTLDPSSVQIFVRRLKVNVGDGVVSFDGKVGVLSSALEEGDTLEIYG